MVCMSAMIRLKAIPFCSHLLLLPFLRTDWSILTWLSVACVPAFLYVIQSVAALMAYQNLDALTFNILNQSKTLSAALCCYVLLGRKQSTRQVMALIILVFSGLVMEQVFSLDFFLQQHSTEETNDVVAEKTRRFTHGVAPILLASFLSGLAGAICQRNLQDHGRNPYLFCMELCTASSIILSTSLLATPDGKLIKENGFFGDDWNYQVFIPIVTNALGGVLVGLVTKYAGSVRKGFALIFGILISGLLQSESVSAEQVVGGSLATISLWMHSTKDANHELSESEEVSKIGEIMDGNKIETSNRLLIV